MMEWYYILGIISYGIFLIQFILSQFFGDLDLDVDFDGDIDFGVSDLLSFKGLIHFCMGLSGWLMVTGKVTLGSVAIGCLIGLTFVIGLALLYRLCMKLSSEPTRKTGKKLIGNPVTVYVITGNYTCIGTTEIGGITTEITCLCTEPPRVGEIRSMKDYQDGLYYI